MNNNKKKSPHGTLSSAYNMTKSENKKSVDKNPSKSESISKNSRRIDKLESKVEMLSNENTYLKSVIKNLQEEILNINKLFDNILKERSEHNGFTE